MPSKKQTNKSLSPIVKWSGGKKDELKNILPHIPQDFDTYLEPFIGGGSVFFELLKRYNSTKKKTGNNYVVSEGARGEYWVWDPDNNQSIYAPILNNKHIEILHILGVKSYNFEVDSTNLGVYKFSINNGASEVRRFKLPDGRERILLNYDVKKMFKIKKINKKERNL